MARESRAERREQIVTGLATVLQHASYAEASVAQIARAAGLTAGLVHYHFGSKREVLLALMDRLVDAWRARVGVFVEAASGPLQRIRGVVDATLALDATSDTVQAQLWTTLGAEASRNEDVASAFRGVLHEGMLLIEGDLAELGVPDPTRAARSLVAALQGVFQLASVGLVPPGEGADLVHRLVDALVGER